jgi:hypothetical protein
MAIFHNIFSWYFSSETERKKNENHNGGFTQAVSSVLIKRGKIMIFGNLIFIFIPPQCSRLTFRPTNKNSVA